MIYVLEDDASIREMLVYTINNVGMEASGFGTVPEFDRAMEERLPELILLDIMLPGEDGLSILRRLRRATVTRQVPVIMVTARGNEYDRVIGLDLGADDYITKPFGMMELIARIRAVLRRSNRTEESDVYMAGALVMDDQKREVRVNHRTVPLTRKEYELLGRLLRSPGQVFTRDQLLQSVWGYPFDGENRTVDVHIRTLRQKLGEAGDLIETVRGIGYKIGGRP